MHKLSEKELTEKQVEQIIGLEAESLADALGNGIELNDGFIDNYCSEQLKEVLKEIPEKDREFHLQDHIGDWRTMNGYDCGRDINLPVGEIEWQDEEGELFYIPCDGICFQVDIDGLEQDWQDWNEE